MTYRDYYDLYIKQNGEGICKTCGKETKFERGTYRVFCCVSCMRRNPEIQEKTKITSIERNGGVGLQSDKIKKKAQSTCIDKYGVKNPYMKSELKEKAHSVKAQEKYRQTMLDRYGVTSPLDVKENKAKIVAASHTKEAKQKRKQSTIRNNLEKYGVEHNFQRDDVIQSIKSSRLKRQQKFCIDNDCTPLTELINLYGTGWCQSNMKVDSIFDGNVKYIKNYEIDKIKNYVNTTTNSHDEEYIYKFITSIYSGKVIKHDRTTIAPLELDIYIPDKKVAIEYNGVYWHSTNIGMDKNYHLNKTKLCEAKGIRLIHIFQNEWNSSKEICKSIISSAIGIYNTIIYARNCIVKEVSSSDTKVFLDTNHIQGAINASYRLGLYYNNELVQLICIGKSRFKKDEYELLRMCTKLNIQVIGGFSKLLKHQPYKSFVSYIDRAKFTGNSYSYNFTFDSYTKPSYFYWSKKTGRISRTMIQKHKLSKLLGTQFDPLKTEIQNMMDAGFYQIYDCGNMKQYINIRSKTA